MKTLAIEVAEGERTCRVDAEALQAFAKALLDDLLFTAARAAPEVPPGQAVRAQISFTISVDPRSGQLVVAY